MSQLVLELLDRQRSGELFNEGILGFYAFCQQRLARSYAQIYQDLWVLFMLREKRGGFFVEFGACDGKLLSNTLLLEEGYGWTGILAEPNHHWHPELAARRCRISHQCVAAESGKRIHFSHVPAMPELSRITDIVPADVHERSGNREQAEQLEVETISLLDLLRLHEAPPVVDYLSLDTEGSEYEIMKSFDFGFYSFRLLSVEHAGEEPKRTKLRELLESHGYRRWRPELSRWDDWYINESIR